MHKPNPHKCGYFELIALIATGLLKFILLDWLEMRAFFITGIFLFWLGYVLYRYSVDHKILVYWGFKKEYLGRSMLFLFPFLAVGIFVAVVLGTLNKSKVDILHLLPVLALYPLWGIVQQFLMICIVAENLSGFKILSRHKPVVIVIASILFGLIHFPDFSLMIFTFAMETAFLVIYYKWRNLWAVGLAHGWIATFLLYYVHNRDLWTELFVWF